MPSDLTSKQRVIHQLRGWEIDRIPTMGGWIEGVDILSSISGLSVDAYLADPVENLMSANRALGVDCMIKPIIPLSPDQIRTGYVDSQEFSELEPEDLFKIAEKLPDTRTGVVAGLDLARIEHEYRDLLTGWIKNMGVDIWPITTVWESVPNFMMYGKFGYEAYFTAIGLYPKAIGRLYWESATIARVRNEILATLISEYDLPPVLFTGHDICNNAGPMCSMSFLKEYYFPEEKYALEPLLEAGIRVVRHCDGNVMPILDDSIVVGYTGFQGFQYECDIDVRKIASLRTITGEDLIFFAGMNVTRTLPFGDTQDIRNEIDFVLDYTDGGRGLFFFTSSSIGPEVPVENILTAYRYITQREYLNRDRKKYTEWPGLHKEIQR